MENDSSPRQEHHRRPRSIGGTSKPANISYLNEHPHRDWHTIVGNMNAYQICNLLNKLKYKPDDVILVCKFINGSEVKGHGLHNSKNKHKIDAAWKNLFGDLEFTDIIEYINYVLLDPSYHIYIEKPLQL
jgi:hypothetical protein